MLSLVCFLAWVVAASYLGLGQGWGFPAGPSLELELELTQTRVIQKPLLWVEVGKSLKVLVCLWGFANCASFHLLDMTRNAPHFWTFSLDAWSASYGE
jgi:hypothetical protein